MDNILKSLLDFSGKGEIIDRDFMINTIESVAKAKRLKSYIKRVEFKKLESYETNIGTIEIPAFYCILTKEIELDIDIVEMVLEQLYKTVNWEFSNYEHYVFRNIMLLHILLHEIEHASEHKQSRIKNGSIKNILLAIMMHTDNVVLDLDYYDRYLIFTKGILNNKQAEIIYQDFLLNNELEKKYRNASLVERLANIVPYQNIYKMVNPIKAEIPHVINYLEASIINSCVKYYKLENNQISCPTIKYLEDIRRIGISGIEKHFNDEYYKKMDEASAYSLKKRLILGINISPEEYKYTKRLLKQKTCQPY